MTLRHFLDAAFALLVGEYQRIGLDLLSALEKVAAWGAGASEDETVQHGHSNDVAMAQLQAKLAGVSGIRV